MKIKNVFFFSNYSLPEQFLSIPKPGDKILVLSKLKSCADDKLNTCRCIGKNVEFVFQRAENIEEQDVFVKH